MGKRLSAFALRVGADAYFLAEAFEVYADSEQLDDRGLATMLGCEVADLEALRLCRRPRVESDSFRRDVKSISERFDLDPAVLAQVLRRADAVAALRFQTSDRESLLTAARDRIDETTSTPDEGPKP